MSMNLLIEMIDPLPYALKEQVLGYARSIAYSAPEILKETGAQENKDIANKLIFIAGVKKLYSILDSNYWVLDNAGAILAKQQGQSEIRVGSANLSRNGTYHKNLRKVREELWRLISDLRLTDYIEARSYGDVVRMLTDGN